MVGNEGGADVAYPVTAERVSRPTVLTRQETNFEHQDDGIEREGKTRRPNLQAKPKGRFLSRRIEMDLATRPNQPDCCASGKTVARQSKEVIRAS